MAYCKNCGSEIPDGARFCPGCGAPNAEKQVGGEGVRPYAGPQAFYGRYRANIQKKDIAVCVILSIVTCGIYGLIWFCSLVNDLNVAAQTPEDSSPGMVVVLSIVTCGIYGIYWLYCAGEKVDRIRQMSGEAPENSSILYLILSLFGLSIIVYCFIQSELNKVANA